MVIWTDQYVTVLLRAEMQSHPDGAAMRNLEEAIKLRPDGQQDGYPKPPLGNLPEWLKMWEELNVRNKTVYTVGEDPRDLPTQKEVAVATAQE
jgi:hypothetical protein